MNDRNLRSDATLESSDQDSDNNSEYNDPSPFARSTDRNIHPTNAFRRHENPYTGPRSQLKQLTGDTISEDRIPPLRKLAQIGSLKMSQGDKRFSLGMNSATRQDSELRDEGRSRSNDSDDEELSASIKQYSASLQAGANNSTPDSPNVADNYRSTMSFTRDPLFMNSTPNPNANKTNSPSSSRRPVNYKQTPSQDGQEFSSPNGEGFRLRQNPPLLSNQTSQTPSRPYESGLKNLSISDEEDNLSTASGGSVVRWHPYAQSHSSSPVDGRSLAGSPGSHSAHHHCPVSYASLDSDNSGDSTSMDANLIFNADVTTAIARDVSNQMKVKKATVLRYTPDEDYKMTADPRGICLILNNVDFEFPETFATRLGSDQDAKRMDELFTDLGFKTILRRNLTADQMRDCLSQVALQCKPEHDALFVMIFSHGNEHSVYGTDGIEVNLDDEVFSRFDNRNCQVMIGRPKVFVIQACRGDNLRAWCNHFSNGYDAQSNETTAEAAIFIKWAPVMSLTSFFSNILFGANSHLPSLQQAGLRDGDCDSDATDSVAGPPPTSGSAASAEGRARQGPSSWLQQLTTTTIDKKQKHHVRSDMLIIYSCLAGYVSVRHELAGSWMGVALAYYIIKHAHDKDLQKILNLVTSDVSRKESSHGYIQTMESKYLGWTKNLYFNPGIYQ